MTDIALLKIFAISPRQRIVAHIIEIKKAFFCINGWIWIVNLSSSIIILWNTHFVVYCTMEDLYLFSFRFFLCLVIICSTNICIRFQNNKIEVMIMVLMIKSWWLVTHINSCHRKPCSLTWLWVFAIKHTLYFWE